MLDRRIVTGSVFLILCLGILTTAAVYWNEARKEIVFLCGNFSEGVSEDSVVSQLDTGNFLTYQKRASASGSRIEVDSRLTLGMYRCIIDLGPDGLVRAAWVE